VSPRWPSFLSVLSALGLAHCACRCNGIAATATMAAPKRHDTNRRSRVAASCMAEVDALALALNRFIFTSFFGFTENTEQAVCHAKKTDVFESIQRGSVFEC